MPIVEIDPRLNFVRGAAIYASDIDKLGMTFKSFKIPLTESLTSVIIPSIKQNFAQQGRPRWKPLTKKTIYNRLIEGYPRGPILNKSGRLQKAAIQKNIWDVTTIGSGSGGYDMLSLRTEYFDQLVPYAEFQQLGAKLPRSRGIRSLKGLFGSSGGVGRPAGRPVDVSSGGFSEFFDVQHFPTTGGQLPARPFIQLQVEDEVEIYAIFTSFMNAQVDKHWGPESRGMESI